MDDPELHELFEDPADQEVIDLLRTSRPSPPPLDPHFRNYLRAKLMAEARRTLPTGSRRPWFQLGPMALAPALAAVAAGFIVVLGVEIWLHNQPTAGPVAVNLHNIQNKTNVATAEPIQIQFSGPVDKNAIAESVQIEPATSATKQWVGQTLVIIPDHPLAPNTNYTVTLKPAATAPPSKPTTQPSPTPAPTPVVVHFTTVPAPVPRVVPPSYKSGNVTYGHDSRLATSGDVLSGTWTPDGQLLITRPAGAGGPGAIPSPSTTATPSATPSGPPAPKPSSDVWLMSGQGRFIREVAAGGMLPSAASSGSLIADWRQSSADQWALEVHDRQGKLVATVVTVESAPDRPVVWLGADHLAYVDKSTLHIVDLLGVQVKVPELKVDPGGLAASVSGALVAVQTSDGSAVLDLSASPVTVTKLLTGATGFAWSAKGDLAFVVQQDAGMDLYVAPDGKTAKKVASSPRGQTWSDLSWAPDASSILFASKPIGGSIDSSRLMLINPDGTNAAAFAASQKEYAAPQWSPLGDFVLFTRTDEAGGRAFYTASVAPSAAAQSAVDAAENDALTEVDKFMQARLQGDLANAQRELDDAGTSAYQNGASTLLSPTGTKFDRYYPASVQLAGTDASMDKFLVTVRIFIAKSGHETSFFEEHLTVVKQGQRYFIDAVTSTPTVQLGHGPSVVSVEAVPEEGREQVKVQFDADLSAATVTHETVFVRDRDGNVLPEEITFDPDRHLVTLRVKLKSGDYKLVVTTGLTDINGNALTQEYDAPLVISR